MAAPSLSATLRAARSCLRFACRAAGNDDGGGGEFGPFRLGDFFADEGGQASVVLGVDVLHARGTALRGGRIETSASYRDHFLRIARLDGGNRVASIDGSAEGVCGFNADDVGDHLRIQHRRHARQEVLAGGGVAGKNVVVGTAHIGHQGAHILRQSVFVGRVVCDQHPPRPADSGGFLRHCRAAAAGHQDVELAADGLRGGHHAEGDRAQGRVVVFRDDQDAPRRFPPKPRSLSLRS